MNVFELVAHDLEFYQSQFSPQFPAKGVRTSGRSPSSTKCDLSDEQFLPQKFFVLISSIPISYNCSHKSLFDA